MSEILKMATGFGERSKRQAENTEQTVRSAFEKHESALLSALSESEKRTSAAIAAQSRRLQRTALTSWLAVLIPVSLTLLLGAGVLWWMGQSIADKVSEIERYNANLEQLKAQGGAIQFSRCGESDRLCVKIDLDADRYGDRQTGEYPWAIPEGY
jgi:hypothetical protein